MPPPDALSLRGQALGQYNDDLLAGACSGWGSGGVVASLRIFLLHPPSTLPPPAIDSLRRRRDAAVAALRAADADKATLGEKSKDIASRLAAAADACSAAASVRAECEAALAQAEDAYAEILDSAAALADALRAECGQGEG